MLRRLLILILLCVGVGISAQTNEKTLVGYVMDAGYKYVAMGYKMASEMMPAIKEMSASKKRIIVQGVYLTSSAREIAEGLGIDETLKRELGNSNVEVVFGDKGILPASSAEVCVWIRERTLQWLNR